MIDKIYIDGAIKIRKEFLKLNNELLSYEKDLLQLKSNLENIVEKFDPKEYKNMSNEDIKKNVEGIFLKMDIEYNKTYSKIKSISDSIDKIKKEENDLFYLLKEKYPDIKEEDLIKEIQSHLEN